MWDLYNKKYKVNNFDYGVNFILVFNNNIEVYFLYIHDTNYVFFDIDILTNTHRVVISQRGQIINIYQNLSDPYYNFKILNLVNNIITDWKKNILKAVENIVLCLKKGNKCNLHCDINDGMKVLKLCYRIVESV